LKPGNTSEEKKMDIEKKHYRSCNICEAMCGIVITTKEDEIISIKGDKDDVHSKGYTCPKAFALKDLYNDPDRLRHPVRKVGDQWRRISWKDAFDEIGKELKLIRKRYGKDANSLYFGNPTVYYHGTVLFANIFAKAIDTKNRYSASSLDQLPSMMVANEMYGHHFFIPVPDLDRTDYFLMLGANPAVSGGSIFSAPGFNKKVSQVSKRGKVVVVDPVKTRSAVMADKHIFIKPGTDVFFLLGMLHTLYKENLINPGRLKSFTDGLDQLAGIVSDYSPERVSAPTGIPAEVIREIAIDFSAAKSAVCYGRMGTSIQEFGTLSSWLIHLLNVVTGNLDSPGGFMFTNSVLDIVGMMVSSGVTGSFNQFQSRLRGLPELGNELPTSTLAEEILTDGTGKIRSLITVCGNPVLSAPNGRLMNEAIKNLDFMVAIDWYINETTRHADIILPPVNMLEQDYFPILAMLVCSRNFAKYASPVFRPDPDAREAWQIMKEIAIRLTTNLAERFVIKSLTPKMLLKLGIRFGPYGAGLKFYRKGLTLKKIQKAKHGLDLGPLKTCLPNHLHNEEKRINAVPQIFAKGLSELKKKFDKEMQTHEKEFDLLLVSRRNIRTNNSWLHNVAGMHNKKNQCTVWVNPADADRLGIVAGAMVEVSSRVGAISIEAEVTDRIMQGVICIPHGWGHGRKGVKLGIATKNPGVSVNDITDHSRVDTICGNAVFSGVPVKIARINGSAS
jgi:anaerobic selenocysteine-containing dehydrogenase